MKYSDLKQMILTQWQTAQAPGRGQDSVFLILGKPGGGKSALSFEVVKEMGGTPENTVVFVPSLRDPVDVLGTPNNRDHAWTEWVPPKEFYKLRKDPKAPGPKFLIIEEMTDSSVAMMNAMCRIVHDRYAGDLELSDELYIIGTGNRTEDKSGANRLTSKLGNRLNVQEYDENLDDWVDWALKKNIDPVLIQFLRFATKNFSNFKADAPFGKNPTPRAWEKVSGVSQQLPAHLFLAACGGFVGEGPAAEYIGFRKIHDALISFEEVVMNPTKAKIPSDLSAQYAIVGSLSHHSNEGNIDRVAQYVKRLPSDFGVMFWQDTVKRTPKIKGTKPFIEWASDATNVILGN